MPRSRSRIWRVRVCDCVPYARLTFPRGGPPLTREESPWPFGQTEQTFHEINGDEDIGFGAIRCISDVVSDDASTRGGLLILSRTITRRNEPFRGEIIYLCKMRGTTPWDREQRGKCNSWQVVSRTVPRGSVFECLETWFFRDYWNCIFWATTTINEIDFDLQTKD